MKKFWYIVHPVTLEYWTERDEWSSNRDDALEYYNEAEATEVADHLDALLEEGYRAQRVA